MGCFLFDYKKGTLQKVAERSPIHVKFPGNGRSRKYKVTECLVADNTVARLYYVMSTLCLRKKTSPMFLAITRESIVRFS